MSLKQEFSSNARDGNVQVKPTFSRVALFIAGFLLFCVFTYWFVDSSSSSSIVNLALKKADSRGRMSIYPEQYLWISFYLHLIVTFLMLAIYWGSGISKWLGNFISEQYFVEKFYHFKHRATVNVVAALKILISLAFVYQIYGLVMGMVASEAIPISEGTNIIVLVVLLSIVWNIKKVDETTYPSFTGPLNNRSKRLWFRLSGIQFAYVQETVGGSKWKLYDSEAFIDLSYTECYLFHPTAFTIEINDKTISKDLIGSVKYTVRSEIREEKLPNSLSTSEVLKLYNTFTNSNELDRMIYMLMDNGSLLQDAKDNMLIAAQEYFNIDQNIFKNNTAKNKSDIANILKSRIDFREIDQKIEKQINKEACRITGSEELIKLSFKISDSEFKMDDMLKDVFASQRSAAEKVTDSSIKVQDTMYQTILTSAATNPAFNKTKADIMLGLASKLNQSFSQDPKQITGDPISEAPAIASPMKIASEQVVNAILEVMETEPSAEAVAEAISGSTNFISENNIPISDFMKRYFQKLESERMERSYEAYRQLVEDTLMELMPKQ